MSNETEDIINVLIKLKEQIQRQDILFSLCTMKIKYLVNKRQNKAIEKVKEFLSNHYKKEIETMNFLYECENLKKSLVLKVLRRVFIEASMKAFGSTYFYIRNLLFAIKESIPFLTDLLIQAGQHIKHSKDKCEHLIETVIQLFYIEANTQLYDLLRSVFRVRNIITV